MATPLRTQPPWQEPHPGQPSKLLVYNSLTRQKNPFRPIDKEGKEVTWYSCGPTVYDDAHLGHARNYVSNDILRRILEQYFGYSLRFVQNITDIDDKIILRGRQAYLLSHFQSENPKITPEVLVTTQKAFVAYISKNLPLLPSDLQVQDFAKVAAEKYAAVIDGKSLDGTGPGSDHEAKIKMHLKTAGNAVTALIAPSKTTSADIQEFWRGAEDVLLPYLDSLHGASIDGSNYSIWETLTKKYEGRFFEDMDALNVLRPSVVTRVTEFTEDISRYIKKIVDNGFAYATESGDIYFDIQAFEKLPNNHYARLEPTSRGNTSLQADGEGALSTNPTGKRNNNDFALFKVSKPSEPFWPGPYDKPGRPGWHIECSVMSSATLGPTMDIHSGGIDLCFPHHDNELAQSESYWSNTGGHQAVNYFLHMGHLSIAGAKMSKSLKNFTTVREALARGDWTARSFRVILLLNDWHSGIEITDDMKKAGASWEGYLTNFFLRVNDLERHPNIASTGTEDERIKTALEWTKTEVDEALSDSFNTGRAMLALKKLVETWNSADQSSISDEVSRDAARFITRIVRIFGLDGVADPNNGGIGWSGIDIPAEAKDPVYAVARIRDEVRQRAIANDLSEEVLDSIISRDQPDKQQDAAAVPYAEVLSTFIEDLKKLSLEKAPAKSYLALSDEIRDKALWNVGVYLEDRSNAPAMVRPVDAELRAEREQKEAIARQKAEAKAKREREEAEKKAKLAAQAKINPQEMFRTDEYSAWDDDGLPTKDKEGADVPKSKGKKLRKEWEKQKKLYEEHLKGAGSS